MNTESGLNGLLQGNTNCSCGRAHTVRTKCIMIGHGALRETGNAAQSVGLAGKALVVADRNTWGAAGCGVAEALESAGFGTNRFIFPEGELHTDEHAVGSILMALADDVKFIAAVGSGTINDSCRFVAKRTGLPYIVIGTAPSMDGYASDVSPVMRGGFKMTFPGVAPLAIIGDTAVLKAAPMNMMAAGFGDVFGKITARLDWLMAHRLLGEYRCGQVAGVMAEAVDACMAAAPGLRYRDDRAVEGLMKGLVLSGIAMQMIGDSRPASGCEHHVAHFLEMLDLARGRGGTLHGDKVGMAELLLIRLYEKFFEPASLVIHDAQTRAQRESAMRRDLGAFAETVIGQNCSAVYYSEGLRQRVLAGMEADWAMMRGEAEKLPGLRAVGGENIRGAGGPVRPSELGYDRKDILLALMYAMELRDKFTILRLAHLSGRLDGLAEELADEFC